MEFLEYAMSSGIGSSAIFTVVALLLAIVATVLICIFILPEKKRPGLNAFFRFLHDTFNFRHLLVEKILKILYIYSTVCVILVGFFNLFQFTTSYYDGSVHWHGGTGLLVMILGPILVRVLYELMMMAVLLVKNVISIRNKLDEGGASDLFNLTKPDTSSKAAHTPTAPAQPVAPSTPVEPQPVRPIPVQPVQKPESIRPIQPIQPIQPVRPESDSLLHKPEPIQSVEQPVRGRFCTQCGTKLDESGRCPSCGR